MRIFFICQRVPYPPDRGDKIITFHEIKHFARDHEVHVFCLADGVGDLDNVPHLRRYAETVTAVAVSTIRQKLRILLALLSGKSLSVAAFNERKLHALIKRKYDELRPEIIFVYSGNVAQYAEHFERTARIMQFQDLDSLKWGSYADFVRPPLKWLYQIERRRLLAYERLIANSFAHCLVCTTQERDDFKRYIPTASISVVGNGVDLDYFCSTKQSKHKGSIIFTGVMDYLPNVDAMLWFCNNVLPIVQSRIPTATLTICGSNPTASVRSLADRQGVTVTGRVPDTRPYLDRAELSVAPLRIARGIQNKIIEAMAMGLPVVASANAWKGTVIAQGDGILVADKPGEFANHVVRLLQDSGYRAEMSGRARATVEANYRWAVQLTGLDQVLSTIAHAHKAVHFA